MSINLDLNPDVEERLDNQARDRGVPLQEYVRQILEKQAETTPKQAEGKTLLQALDSLRGIVPDEWLNFEVDRSPGREVSFD